MVLRYAYGVTRLHLRWPGMHRSAHPLTHEAAPTCGSDLWSDPHAKCDYVLRMKLRWPRPSSTARPWPCRYSPRLIPPGEASIDSWRSAGVACPGRPLVTAGTAHARPAPRAGRQGRESRAGTCCHSGPWAAASGADPVAAGQITGREADPASLPPRADSIHAPLGAAGQVRRTPP